MFTANTLITANKLYEEYQESEYASDLDADIEFTEEFMFSRRKIATRIISCVEAQVLSMAQMGEHSFNLVDIPVEGVSPSVTQYSNNELYSLEIKENVNLTRYSWQYWVCQYLIESKIPYTVTEYRGAGDLGGYLVSVSWD